MIYQINPDHSGTVTIYRVYRWQQEDQSTAAEFMGKYTSYNKAENMITKDIKDRKKVTLAQCHFNGTLSTAVFHVCKYNNLETVQDLLDIDNYEISKWTWIGKRRMKEILAFKELY